MNFYFGRENTLHFMKQTANIDLGDTSIENIFINDFMPMANGAYVKVYLLGYKYATDKDSSIKLNHNTISRHLTLPLSDVLNAWDFWESKGIIKKHPISTENQDQDETDYTIEFLSLKQLYIDNNYKAISVSTKKEEPSSDTYTCAPSDLIEATKAPEISQMFYEINQLVRRSLAPKEMMDILNWFYNYNMSPDVIVSAFAHCIEQKNIKNLRYIAAVIRNWYDQGITTLDKLNSFLEKTDVKYSQYKRIFKALGFSREPSESEKKVIDTWINEWNFSMEIILKACENSKKTANPNINYINSILNAWKKDNVQSVEDVVERENKPKNIQKKSNKPSTNKFNNFEQRGTKYSNEELEKMIRWKR